MVITKQILDENGYSYKVMLGNGRSATFGADGQVKKLERVMDVPEEAIMRNFGPALNQLGIGNNLFGNQFGLNSSSMQNNSGLGANLPDMLANMDLPTEDMMDDAFSGNYGQQLGLLGNIGNNGLFGDMNGMSGLLGNNLSGNNGLFGGIFNGLSGIMGNNIGNQSNSGIGGFIFGLIAGIGLSAANQANQY